MLGDVVDPGWGTSLPEDDLAGISVPVGVLWIKLEVVDGEVTLVKGRAFSRGMFADSGIGVAPREQREVGVVGPCVGSEDT